MDKIPTNVTLRSLQEIPEVYRSLFSAYPSFNRVQSAVFNDIIHSNSSLVITAPTGSGKTVVFELAILKLMMDYPDLKSVKIVYVAPVKALCNERFNDWQGRFKAFNMSVIEVTGDSIDHCDLQDHQIIITTPEKWDSLTRRWRDNVSLVQLVKLVMIDEVHLLSDNKRGPILETIVCRMKTVMRVLKLQTSLRFIAVSATIFNIEDLAKWLGTNENDFKFHRFGQEARPVTLNRVVKGYPINKSPYLFDIQLSYKLKPLLVEYGNGKPTLIFCSTRRGVVQTCKTLMENITFNFNPQQTLVLQEISAKIVDVKLKEYIRLGGAYHHAGMAFEDRQLVQNAFADGIVPVLVATSTLAMGVNLPAHLVIIKSTHQYIAGRIVEYSESSVLQMVGRAGRPQFDTTATAIIMTKSEMVHKYQNLLDCKEVIESSLHLHLPEQLNAEIVLLTIFDLSVAMQWIQCTFFYLRALKNPQHYGLSGNSSKIEKDLELMVLRAINALKRSQLIDMNENGLDITPTINGRLMSHYYINFNTFQLFFKITEFATIKEIIEILSNANELTEIQLRVNDRRPLNELNVNKNMETIRFQLNGKIKTRELKINCLLQACLGCLPLDSNLQQESTRIINVLERIVKCLTEFLTKKNSYCSLLSSVILSKCLHAKLWENSAFVARQLDRIGATLGATLVALGKTSFNSIIESHPHELERIVNRGPPFGSLIIEQVRHLPMYSLLIQVDRKSVINYTLIIKISIINRDLLLIHNTAGHNHSIVLIVGDTNNRLVMFKRIFDENILSANFEVAVEINPPMPQKVFIHVISEQWVGIDVMKDILVNPMAQTVVGYNCYLPGVVQNLKRKERKAIEDKTQKENGIVKKINKPVAIKIIPKNLPNLNNLDNYCCFDLEPDWVGNSPELVDKNVYENVQKLISANNDMPCEVPDISSPIIQDSFIEYEGMYKLASIISNSPVDSSCVISNEIENIPEYGIVKNNIQYIKPNIDFSNTNFSAEPADDKANSIDFTARFESDQISISDTENMPNATNIISNSDAYNWTNPSVSVVQNCRNNESNYEKSFVADIQDHKSPSINHHIWRQPIPANLSECDKNVRSDNSESFDAASMRQFPYSYCDNDNVCNAVSMKTKFSDPNNIPENYSKASFHNLAWKSKFETSNIVSNSNIVDPNIPSTRTFDNAACYQSKPMFSNISTYPKIDNLFEVLSSNHNIASDSKIIHQDIPSTRKIDNVACYQSNPISNHNISTNPEIDNNFDFSTSKTIHQNIRTVDNVAFASVHRNFRTVNKVACYQSNPIFFSNHYISTNPEIDNNFDFVTSKSVHQNIRTVDNVACYQTKPMLFSNHSLGSTPKIDNLFNVSTLNTFPDNCNFDRNIGIIEQDSLGVEPSNIILSEPINEISNTRIHQPELTSQNNCDPNPLNLSRSNLIKSPKFNHVPKNIESDRYEFKSNICNSIPSKKLTLAEDNKINNMEDCNDPLYESTLPSNCEDKPYHFARSDVLKSAILNTSRYESNFSSIEPPKKLRFAEESTIYKIDGCSSVPIPPAETILQGNYSNIAPCLSKSCQLKSSILNHLPKNVEPHHCEFKSKICNIEPPRKLALAEKETTNKIKDCSNLPIPTAETILQSNCTDIPLHLTSSGHSAILNHPPKDVKARRYEFKSIISNIEPTKKSKLSEENPIHKTEDCSVQNPPWQVSEVLTPVDFNIASQIISENKDNKNIESIMSQCLPNISYFNTQRVDPSETTTNWNEFEQNLLSGSQKKSKLSSFRERFCYKKSANIANYPFTSQKTMNSTQDSNFQKFNISTPKSNSFCAQKRISVVPQEVATANTNSMPVQSSLALGNRNSMPKELGYISNGGNKENIPPKSLKSLFAAAQAAKSQSKHS